MATTSKISLCSNALLMLGHQSIASFDEPTTGAELASNLYESTYLSVLTGHRWRFATKQKELSRLSATPISNWSYQFQLPSDLLYLIRVYNVSDYEIYGDKIYCNSSTATIEYTYRVDEGNLPPFIVKAIEFFLASQFALPITGDINKSQLMAKVYLQQIQQAQFADSSQRPNVAIQSNPFTDVRN